MIGAFHSPRLVLADVSTLSTLPAREWRCGLAEAIKHAVIADPGLAEDDIIKQFAALRTTSDGAPFAPDCQPSKLAEFVARALAVKVAVVREDPLEPTGSRARLNLGHTIGHAVEIASGFRIKHGEAVSIGTVEEARLAVRLGHAAHDLPERIADIFESVGLPVSLPQGITLEALAPIIAHDKKNANGRVRYALPFAMGDVRLVTA